jgi:hypothetical protein
MAGASAVIAVTPQMDVPALKRSDMEGGNPAHRPARGKNNNPAPTEETTTGIPTDPADKRSKKLSFAATQTMPPCNIILVEYTMPG